MQKGVRTGIGLGGDLERRHRQDDARLKLAFMRRYDPVIESYNRLPSRSDLSAGEIERWRQRRREEYRHATGVEIEERHALREKLAEVVETGSMTVEQAIEEIRRSYVNGLSATGSRDGAAVGSASEDWL
jgi:hypothetical protein